MEALAAAAAAVASRLPAKRDQPSPDEAARLVAAVHAARLCTCLIEGRTPDQRTARLAGQLARVALSAAPAVLPMLGAAAAPAAEQDGHAPIDWDFFTTARLLTFVVDSAACKLLEGAPSEQQAAAVPVELLPAWLTAVGDALLSTAHLFPEGGLAG